MIGRGKKLNIDLLNNNATTKTHSFKHLMEAKSSYKAFNSVKLTVQVLSEAPKEKPITPNDTRACLDGPRVPGPS